jgi:hypothetical protein
MSNKHECQYCRKQYTRKSSYSRHIILCEIFYENKTNKAPTTREKICEEEESSNLPSTKQLYKIIQELATKYKNMEEKMNDMQKWVDKKKRKIKVIQWLNVNIKPNVSIQTWMQNLQATEEDVEILIEQNMTKTISSILNKKLKDDQDKKCVNPLYCVSQKTNLFYCYISDEEKWKQFSTDEFINMLKRIHSKILNALCEWYDKNIDRINQSDKMQLLYNKTMIKLMSANFTQDAQILSKIRSELYQHLKVDLTNVIECEFEF